MLSLTCQLPLFWWHFAGSLYHRHRPKIAIGDSHEQGEKTRPSRMGQGGCIGWIHTHDEQRDEDHPQAREEEQAASRPVIWQCRQDLKKEHGVISVKFYSAVHQKFCETRTRNTSSLHKRWEKWNSQIITDLLKDSSRKSLKANVILNPFCWGNSLYITCSITLLKAKNSGGSHTLVWKHSQWQS